mmetsp:Transcript_14323/g.36376  ORF Transcript_14323/g.36376 Transcript_14323/m.36376 type:complete len:116 (-) Transcript_14323:1340-1687(-)
MGKKQTAERERRALEADGLGFALNLDTKAKAKAPSTQQEGTRGRRGDAQGGLQPSKRIAAAAREKEEDDDESGEEDNDESGEEEQEGQQCVALQTTRAFHGAPLVRGAGYQRCVL